MQEKPYQNFLLSAFSLFAIRSSNPRMPSSPPLAHVAEIVRAQQRDELCIEWLAKDLSDLLLAALGPRTWIRLRPWIDPISNVLYSAFTTLSGNQTIGEEYSSIIQVVLGLNQRAKVPSLWSRLFAVVSVAFGSRIVSKIAGTFFKGSEDKIFKVADILTRLNRSAFYLYGSFSTLTARFAGVQYLSLQSGKKLDAKKGLFRFLAALTAASAAMMVAKDLDSLFFKKQGRVSRTEMPVAPEPTTSGKTAACPEKDRCPLCLDVRKEAACPPCGHLFCWRCIITLGVSSESPKCPLCKVKFIPSRIVPLLNY